MGRLSTIRHKTFAKGVGAHWLADPGAPHNNAVKQCSLCWLFCWAETGMNSDTTKLEARAAFDDIFGPGAFAGYASNPAFVANARVVRYKK